MINLLEKIQKIIIMQFYFYFFSYFYILKFKFNIQIPFNSHLN
jgi:hypothetical protein